MWAHISVMILILMIFKGGVTKVKNFSLVQSTKVQNIPTNTSSFLLETDPTFYFYVCQSVFFHFFIRGHIWVNLYPTQSHYPSQECLRTHQDHTCPSASLVGVVEDRNL